MSTQGTPQEESQAGPVAQQSERLQVHGQPAPGEKPQKKGAHWTGFAGKTLWDWLDLLGAAILIPVAIAAATIWFSVQQNTTSLQLAQQQHNSDQKIAQQQHDSDQRIALDQQRQAVLKACEDDIRDLLLNKGLRASRPGDEVRTVARTEALLTLQQLDGTRKGLLMQFLWEADLVNQARGENVIISLRGADLKDADLIGADLEGADLRGANLEDAALIQANLTNADLSYTNLKDVDLSYADLTDANLNLALNLTRKQLDQASSLSGATMPGGSKHP